MKYHWMHRGNKRSISELKNISNVVDYVGYESMLMVYHSDIPDFWIKAANILNKDHGFKYMPAIRTYAISPEYFYMMYRAFEDIAPDRIMFNIVSGDIRPDEDSITDLVAISNIMQTNEDRLAYTEEWINKFLKISKDKKIPKIVMSGHSDKTKQMAKDNGFTHLSMIDMYLNNNSIINNNQMAALCIFVGDSEDEVKNFLTESPENQLKWTICGTKDQVKEKIIDLSKKGISDIMVSSFEGDPNISRVHSLIKEMIEAQNGIS